MRSLSKPIVVAASVCLLALQWSGLHVHADEAGYIAVPETSSTHHHGHRLGGQHHGGARRGGASADAGDHGDAPAAGPDRGHEHEYEDARDVALAELALGVATTPVLAPPLVLLFSLQPRVSALASSDVVYPVLSGRYTRWRPPLRAPPHFA